MLDPQRRAARIPARWVPACGKRGFSTEGAARRAIRRSRDHACGPLMPYRCRVCGLFHVGGEEVRRARALPVRGLVQGGLEGDD